jgi:hypothetical protein
LPQGKQVDPRLSAFCFLFLFRPFVRSSVRRTRS